MEELIIMDYSTLSVHLYKIDSNININEEYIKHLGYNTDECSWMFGEDIDIFKHQGILI